MSDVSLEDQERPRSAARWMGCAAITATGASIAAIAAIGALGSSAAVPAFGSASPWPPWSATAHPSPTVVSVIMWTAVLVGGAGLSAGLVAVRWGWRPRPGRLIAGSVIAVLALMVIPPVGSTDMLDYAVYGRIAVLGHSPYQMTPLQLRSTGDPVGAVAPTPWEKDPSVYGPLATATEWVAAELGGGSAARIVFWLKVWNGLAYLALVLGLDRLTRSDPARRARAHVLWSLNPLMLLAVMAGGHIDGLSAAIAFFALATLCPGGVWRPSPRRWLLAGLLLGAAAAVKAPLLLAGAGLGWVARRSTRSVAALGAGIAAVLLPCYLVAGWPAVTAVAGRAAGSPAVYEPWKVVGRVLGLHLGYTGIDALGLAGAVVLAVILLWRMPSGVASYPFARPALALMLAWLVTTPQQRPWYDAAIFPLLALMPATRLDWIAVARAVIAALAELPGVIYYPDLLPHRLSTVAGVISTKLAPVALIGVALVLLWLCFSGRWRAPNGRGSQLPTLAGAGEVLVTPVTAPSDE